MTPTPVAVDALDRLHNIPEFRALLDWLEDQVAAETSRAIMATDNADVLRGRAQFGVELMTAIRGNAVTMRKLMERARRR